MTGGATTRRVWDQEQRARAERLDRSESAWAIWYGVGSRRFYAAALWALAEPVLLQTRTAGELRALMRAAESPYAPPKSPRGPGRPPHSPGAPTNRRLVRDPVER
ncbi:hypothetical protein Sru01_68780 [Sphaerisporangium rufum]|uniref:Uncharacterized protein n=1 Tax=Sphaerisporangium rufum TaxID=1381558 RepID=A0A919V289_9ACTN|nr:hypothetical protein Sru01_68780 [Sphaerisporangium rufum]